MADALANCEHFIGWQEAFEEQCLFWILLQVACDPLKRTVMIEAHGTAPVPSNGFDVHYIETGRAVSLKTIPLSIGMKNAWRQLLSLHVVDALD
jgi:hypothetical protein